MAVLRIERRIGEAAAHQREIGVPVGAAQPAEVDESGHGRAGLVEQHVGQTQVAVADREFLDRGDGRGEACGAGGRQRDG